MGGIIAITWFKGTTSNGPKVITWQHGMIVVLSHSW
jgi:hypothetical protein